MKKIMFAAIAAAMTGSVLADTCCNTCETICNKCVYAYEVILLAKTTSGKPLSTTATTCGCETLCSQACYRAPAMKKIAGFVWGQVENDEGEVEGCGTGCGCLDFVEADWTANFWDVGTGKYLTESALTFSQVNGINYSANKNIIEAIGEFTFSREDFGGEGKVTLAGFGTRGKRSNGAIMIQSISGFFAGYFPIACTSCTQEDACSEAECETIGATGWDICTDEAIEDVAATAAYGKWKLQWNATAQERLTQNFSAAALVKDGYETPAE